MMHAPLPGPAACPTDLENAIAAVEGRLDALADALQQRDLPEVERRCAELHRALADAVARFGRAARTGPIAPALRTRLATAGAVVAAQRETLARATAALDRAIDVLLPRAAPAVYDSGGHAARDPWRGSTVV